MFNILYGAGMNETEQLVTFKLPKSLHERFKKACKDNRVSQRYVLEKCIEQWLLIVEKKNLYEN